jgi:S1-C subfamily serine protease
MTQRLRSRLRGFRALSLLVLAAALSPLSTPAADLDPPTPADETGPSSEKTKAAIVKVESGDESFLSSGTGFFIDSQGTLLTSASVIADPASVRVIMNGLALDAKVLGNDPRSGVALLRVNFPDSPFLTLGHAADLKTGYTVVAVGFPLNLPAAAAQGAISGFEIRYLNRFFSTTHIHADVPLSPGQVGGPLINLHGEVVGLIVPSPDDGRSVYALPVEAVEKIMSDFEQFGRAKHGWVGVNVVQVPDTRHDGRTVRVIQAVPGTPASKSGLRPGDTVLRIDTREIYRPADVLDASFFSHVGGTMTVVVRRDEQLFNYNFAVIERPQIPAASTPLSVSPRGGVGQPVLVNRTTVK